MFLWGRGHRDIAFEEGGGIFVTFLKSDTQTYLPKMKMPMQGGHLGKERLKGKKRRQVQNIKILSLATSDNLGFLSRFSKLSPEQLNLRAALNDVHKTSKAVSTSVHNLIWHNESLIL